MAAEKEFPGASWRTLHGLPVAWLGLEHERACRIDHEFQKDDVHGKQERRKAEQQRQEGKAGDGDVDRRYVGNRAAKVREYASSEAHRADDRCKAVIEEDEVGRFAGNICPSLAHCNADMRRLEGGRIVDAVARHGDDFAVLPESLHDPELLLGGNPRKDTDRLQFLAERIEGQLFDLGPRQEAGRRVDAG